MTETSMYDEPDFQDVNPAEQIARVMALLGFAPKSTTSALYAEYSKIYAIGEGGDLGQLTVVFDRGLSGSEPPMLSGFVFTTQYCRRADWDDLAHAFAQAKTEAIEFARVDAKTIFDKLATLDRRSEVITIECSRCGRVVSEFVETKCLDCSDLSTM